MDSAGFEPSISVTEKLLRAGLILLALLCLGAVPARACGPDFPNNLLDSGDYAVLVAPVLRFGEELERMRLVQTRWRTLPSTNDYPQASTDAELNDLMAALKRANANQADRRRICDAHRVQRDRLNAFVAQYEQWLGTAPITWVDGKEQHGEPVGEAPRLPELTFVPGLPEEFADYFEGACAWRNPGETNKANARLAWERLLARPEAERKFKAVWAAYMLGRSWETEDPAQAVAAYQRTRLLAQQGASDSLGLATASLGWEARVRLHQRQYRLAIHLYLEQLAAGDESAIESLRTTAAMALTTSAHLEELAGDAACQKVITAYVIARQDMPWLVEGEEGEAHETDPAISWLEAVAAVGLQDGESRDTESAEKLALAAYQRGAFELAQHWIEYAGETRLTRWLQAKLWLRGGLLDEASAMLAKLVTETAAAPDQSPASLLDNLFIPNDSNHSLDQHVEGELGVLCLSREQYAGALDALLRADYWMDAAYVAERVLTVDELKHYVDQYWPGTMANTATNIQDSEVMEPVFTRGERQIRYLLARRLTRMLRGNEARNYYPSAWQTTSDILLAALDRGWDESQPPAVRAENLFLAAGIARTNGMELLGTELAPDWAIHDGNFEFGVTAESRTGPMFKILPATGDELSRASAHNADPETRFHYRYQAAILAWEAAKFMPNNSDTTALALWTGGQWLKNRDPQNADVFYKALVRRCRKTELGAEADRIRWFPDMDENGQVVIQLPRILDEATALEISDPSPMEEAQTDDVPELELPEFELLEVEDWPQATANNGVP